MKRVASLKERLDKLLQKDLPVAFMDKQRSSGILSGKEVPGEFTNKTVLILDNLISSGSTLYRGAKACKEREAKKIIGAATHGVFSENTEINLSKAPLDNLIITNTLPLFHLSETFIHNKVHIMDTSSLFAEAIKRIATGRSLV